VTACRTTRCVPPLLAVLTVCGCSSCHSLEERFESEDPSMRMGAVLEAGRKADPACAAHLVDCLTDSEAEIRLGAILALEKMTGTRRGYCYYHPAAARAEAVGRWRDWLKGGRATSRPATQPAEGGG